VSQPSPDATPSDLDVLRQENADLRARLAEVEAQLERALAALERQPRSAQRQAAPFSTGERKTHPQKPGRKPGQGVFSRRLPPTPPHFTTEIAVPVPSDGCPACGGYLEHVRTELATVTELPPPPPPHVTAFHVPVCRCQTCGQTVRGRHPDLAADQYGATAHRLGLRVLATAHWLHYGLGVPQRKVPAVLQELRGLRVTQSALCQAALRHGASQLGEAYAALRAAVRTRRWVHTDDTGWKVGGETAFLMGFETEAERVYQIRRQHRNDEVREVVPGDYQGTLITDRGPSYDAQALEKVRQQKCLDHIDRQIKEVLARVDGPHRAFGERLRSLLWEARALWKAERAGTAPDFAPERDRLQQALTTHLADRDVGHPENQRLLNGLGWYHDRGHLLRFLWETEVEPTNNRAERALRPAVIARKVSQCSKNARGAATFSAFVSVLGTLLLRGCHSAVEGLRSVLQTGQIAEAPP